MDKPIPEAVVLEAFQDAMESAHGYRPQVFATGVLVNSRDADRFEGYQLALTAAQPDHLVDANKMVAQQPAAVAPRAWLCTFGEVSGVTTDPKWRDMCARLGQQITPLGPIFTQKPAAVDEAMVEEANDRMAIAAYEKFMGVSADDPAYGPDLSQWMAGWNAARAALEQEPTNG